MTEDSIIEEARSARRYLYGLGMPRPALSALDRLLGQSTSDEVRAEIAWLLLGWHTRRRHGQSPRDLEPLFALAAWPPEDIDRQRRIAVLRSAQMANSAAASVMLEAQLARAPHADLMLALANLAPPEAKVDWLNHALALHGLEPIEPAAGDLPPFDRLRPARPARLREDGPLVSVLVPMFNAADTISTALSSLRWQSWTNLEIIVVDDLSRDNSAAIVLAAAEADPRIQLLSSPTNAGTYVARNRALAQANGAFVTVHDADDWSHPAKIERQVEHLLAHPEAIANMSMKVRASPELKFARLNPPGAFVAGNASSLLFRREPTLAALGSWDSVRVGADTEFVHRLQDRFGPGAMDTLDSGPISLQRHAGGSLTRSGATAYPGFEFGARREYGELGLWFRKQSPNRLRFAFPMTERPYPAPAPMLPQRQTGVRHFDIVIASDFRQNSDANIANVEEMNANAALGLTTGLVQLSVFDLEAPRRRHPWIADAVQTGLAKIAVFGERISCDLLIIRDPRVLSEEQEYVAEIAAADIRIIADRPPLDARFDAEHPLYDPAVCNAYAERLFGRRPIWHPTNPQVRQALLTQGVQAQVALSEDDWPELVTVPDIADRTGPAAGKPLRIGRHGPDHWSAWPASAEEIVAAYPDGRKVRVSVLGTVGAATRILGTAPPGWKVAQHKRHEQAEAFLSRLDAYVFFTRPGIPQFGYRNVLEAMAAGVPVVLDRSAKPTFGPLASYSEPRRSPKALKLLFVEMDETSRMVADARGFVERIHGREAYFARLKPFIGRL